MFPFVFPFPFSFRWGYTTLVGTRFTSSFSNYEGNCVLFATLPLVISPTGFTPRSRVYTTCGGNITLGKTNYEKNGNTFQNIPSSLQNS
ncbi:hypothetical protein Tb927.4.140 [Trypanosoma brucei brucei TREU927]|uniref:Uncharacterized protein n=1 Tax=Trypanosoma brucei brucei (strain 927/4 GUTat10.1) TaxID=185431 RepID=Q57UV5_TRYB2|nr:hypothetical protein Tb927.4.140 [Trypanosoma brucei brucei TREU927]AAX70622.1 hypothetical protein Tb927.4.140 [Trypanosoma brucei]AAZ10611.1 hypothetical protein Tb927.4.140 [Trypanosoma brucei brucei TREU927]